MAIARDCNRAGRDLSARLLTFLVALAATFAVAGCNRGEGDLARTAIHLDPRLEGGLSPAAAFADAEVTVGEWTLAEDPASFGPWRVAGASVGPGGAAGGVKLRPLPDAEGLPALTFAPELSAEQFNIVEVDVRVGRIPPSALTWVLGEGGARGASIVQLRASPEVQTLRFSMVDDPRWRGALSELRLEPCTVRAKPIDVLAIRHIRRGFDPGPSPLTDSGLDSGDGGVITLGDEAFRAWPLAAADPLVAEVTVPRNGRLAFATAATGAGLGAPMELRVDVEADGGRGGEAGVLRHDYAAAGLTRRWERLTCDLAEFAGQDVRLEFTVESSLPLGDRAVALLGAPLVVGEAAPERPPNVLLITLDTTRFDALGSSLTGADKDPRVHSPFLDELAAKSLVFTDAWSAGNSTQPSHASILTGLSIQDHALFDNYGVLSAAATTLAEILRAEGYYTGASITLEAIGASSGFAQGFDRMAPPLPGSHLDGRHQVEMAKGWIDQWSREGERPWFIWLHLYDPHTPYRLPEGALEAYVAATGIQPPPKRIDPPTLLEPDEYPPDVSFLRGINNREHANFLYRVEVAYVDGLLSSLFDSIDAAGDTERTLTVVTADHGEHLAERGIYYSHQGLTPETLHVPLLVHLPGSATGRYVDERVTSRDIVPTVVAALDLDEVPASRDLVAVADAGADRDRPMWFEHANGFQVGCRDDRYHFVTTVREGFRLGMYAVERDGRTVLDSNPVPVGTSFLYDWRADPGLEHNLADEQPELVEDYLARLEAYRAAAAPLPREVRELTEEQAEQLRNLGYTGD